MTPDNLGRDARRRTVTEIFNELRAAGKTDQEIFGEAVEGLKQLARKMINRQHAGDSLHATRFVNEVYIKLFKRPTSEFRWETGEEFFLAVAGAMHDFKVDYIRRKMAAKRGGGKVDSLDALNETRGDIVGQSPSNFEADALHAFSIDQALKRLRKEFPDREKIVVLKYWGKENDGDGLTYEEIADMLKVPPDHVKFKLKQARARLRHYLSLEQSQQ